MRETRSSGSVEGVMGNHNSYSDYVRLSLPSHYCSLLARDDMDAVNDSSAVTKHDYLKNSSSTCWTYKVSSMRQSTPWRILKRVSWSPSISTMRLLRSSAVSRAAEEKVEAVTNSPLLASKRSRLPKVRSR